MTDGKIDAKDASFILVAYSNASTGMDDGLTEDQRAAGDVNSDRIIDAKDASAILAYYSLVSTSVSEWAFLFALAAWLVRTGIQMVSQVWVPLVVLVVIVAALLIGGRIYRHYKDTHF